MKLFKIILAFVIPAVVFNSCQKEYSVENGGKTLPAGNWEFADSTHTYTGNMDSASFVSTGATKELHLNGTSTDGSQHFSMILYADSFQVGSYKASLFQSSFQYTATAKTIYEADQLTGEFIVDITSLSNGLIVGTFSGVAKDSANSLRKITDGKFKSTFGSGSIGSPSTGVLGDSLGNCKPLDLKGAYVKGIALTNANTVQVQVTVAVAGTYSISTNTVNGVTFSTTGEFTNTGVQTVTLDASGTPAVEGDQTFTIKYGNSQCTFTVSFLSAAGNYLPLKLDNNWAYNLTDGQSEDSVFQKVIDFSPVLGGNNYTAVQQSDLPSGTVTDSFYYRKSGGDYYEYINYTSFFGFDQPVTGDFNFLRDNLPAGSTWQSPTISGTVAGGALSGYVKMTILEKGVPVTSIAGFNFPDVIKVRYELFVTGIPQAAVTEERWFAQNVGEIYTSTGSNTSEIKRYQIF